MRNAGDDEEIDVFDFVDESHREYIEGAKAYLGIVVSKSQAPCGYLIYNGDIRSEIGLIRVTSKTTKKSVLCTVIDGYTADEYGYVKNDLLKVDVVLANYNAMAFDSVLPRNSESRAISMSIKLLRKYAPQVKWIRVGSVLEIHYQADALREDQFREGCGISALNTFLMLAEEFKIATVVENIEAALSGIGTMREAGLPALSSKQIIELTRGDRATWELLAKGYTVGINQCERPATKQKLMQYRPQNLTELSAFVAAIRPSFKSKIQAFLDRQHFDYGLRALDALLQTPEMDSSWILYQEQLMGVLGYAGFPMDQAYSIIKAIAKKHPEIVKPLKERFLEGFACRVTEDEHIPFEQAVQRAGEVWQIIDDATNYSFNCSHAVAVSLDALYGAYLKAHYPLQYYKTLLSLCAEKKQKDRIAVIKAEMLAAFGIRLTHCRFGEDNREFAYHTAENTITDALHSIKGVSKGCAVKLHAAARVEHGSWVDFLLYNMENSCVKANQLKTLVKLSYFERFGGGKKLLSLVDEMENGANRIYKTLSDKTKALRHEKLLQMEREMPDEDFSPLEKAAFELEYMGAPVSCFDVPGNMALVLDVNDRYSAKITLYNLRKGTSGMMKIKKDQYNLLPLQEGDVIVVDDWSRRPRYRYSPAVDGKGTKPKPIPGQFDLWITGYHLANEKLDNAMSTNAP